MNFQAILKYFSVIILLFSTQWSLAQKKSRIDDYPSWAANVVWYQIFPERFSNGDPSNDPNLKSIEGTWPYNYNEPWQIHPWTSDWYRLQEYEEATGKDIWHNISRRRYGGDIQGIINKIPYLDSLGIGAIYFNPLFYAPSHHKYDAIMYHHIDPWFGPDPQGDLAMIAKENPIDPKTWKWTSADLLALEMIDKFHQRGIKVIFDGVFNHMGQRSFAFEDLKKKGKKSVYKDWFTINQWADTDDGLPFEYEGWFGVKELPEIKEDSMGIVAGPKKYIFDCTKRWMAPKGKMQKGIDGWRLDVAFCVHHNFWKDWRKHVKSINPVAYLTAEVIEKADDLKPYLQGDEFDAVMNYNFTFHVCDFFIGKQFTPTQFDSALTYLRKAFPDNVAVIMQNLLGSHDTNRISSHVVNGNKVRFSDWGKYFAWSKANNPEYKTRKPDYREWLHVRQLIAFQMTYLGVPMVYYGDEAGMHGANDPDCRKPMVWPEFTYEYEDYRPDQSIVKPGDIIAFDHELFDFHRMLIQFRNRSDALKTGDYKTILVDDEKGLFVFSRSKGSETVIACFNQSNESRNFEIISNIGFSNVMSNKKLMSDKGKVQVNIESGGFVILKNQL
jgi:glycosidase